MGVDVLLEARVRMAGIDTPESRTSDKVEKVFGLASKERVKELLSGDIILKTQIGYPIALILGLLKPTTNTMPVALQRLKLGLFFNIKLELLSYVEDYILFIFNTTIHILIFTLLICLFFLVIL